MSAGYLPSTVERVPIHTAPSVNAGIRNRTARRIEQLVNAPPAAIQKRLDELEQEWDIERALETNASIATLVGLALGTSVDRRWLILPTAVGGFLLQHALQGWCPPLPILRRLGFRTSYEIDAERYALKAMRGDFSKFSKARPRKSPESKAAEAIATTEE